jgi:hypothetical protein
MTQNVRAELEAYFNKYLDHLRMRGNAPYNFNQLDWTAFIIYDFWVRIGHEQGYEMKLRAGKQPFDLCWARTSKSGEVSVHLALESELGGTRHQHDEDFDKIVRLVAPAKVFVCQCTKGESEEEVHRLLEKIPHASRSGTEEAYLIVTHENLGKEGLMKNEGVRGFIADQEGNLVWKSPLERFRWHPSISNAET